MAPGQTENIFTVTGEAFETLVLQADGPVAVEFMSYSCGYCQALEPALQSAAQGLKSREQIFRVNIAAEPNLASSYEIEGTPTFLMFLNGTEVGRVEGPSANEASLMAELTQPFPALS